MGLREEAELMVLEIVRSKYRYEPPSQNAIRAITNQTAGFLDGARWMAEKAIDACVASRGLRSGESDDGAEECEKRIRALYSELAKKP